MTPPNDASDRAALIAERAQLEREIAGLKRGAAAAFPTEPEDTTDEPAGDEVDQAETLEEDERNQALLSVLRARLDEVNTALARLDQGTTRA